MKISYDAILLYGFQVSYGEVIHIYKFLYPMNEHYHLAGIITINPFFDCDEDESEYFIGVKIPASDIKSLDISTIENYIHDFCYDNHIRKKDYNFYNKVNVRYD